MFVLGVNKGEHRLILKRLKCDVDKISKMKTLDLCYDVEFWSKDKQAITSYVLEHYEGWPIHEDDNSYEVDDSAC